MIPVKDHHDLGEQSYTNHINHPHPLGSGLIYQSFTEVLVFALSIQEADSGGGLGCSGRQYLYVFMTQVDGLGTPNGLNTTFLGFYTSYCML